MLNSYQISPKIDDIVKGTFFSNLHAKLHGTLRSNFAFQNGRPQHYRPTEFRGVGIHAVGPLVIFLAQWSMALSMVETKLKGVMLYCMKDRRKQVRLWTKSKLYESRRKDIGSAEPVALVRLTLTERDGVFWNLLVHLYLLNKLLHCLCFVKVSFERVRWRIAISWK